MNETQINILIIFLYYLETITTTTPPPPSVTSNTASMYTYIRWKIFCEKYSYKNNKHM